MRSASRRLLRPTTVAWSAGAMRSASRRLLRRLSLRSSPRKRGPSSWPWTPACAGVSGACLLEPEHVLVIAPALDHAFEPGGGLFERGAAPLHMDADQRLAHRRRHEAAVAADIDHAVGLERLPHRIARAPQRLLHEAVRRGVRAREGKVHFRDALRFPVLHLLAVEPVVLRVAAAVKQERRRGLHALLSLRGALLQEAARGCKPR